MYKVKVYKEVMEKLETTGIMRNSNSGSGLRVRVLFMGLRFRVFSSRA